MTLSTMPSSPGASAGPREDEPGNLLLVLHTAVRYRRVLAALTLGAAVLGVLIALLTPRPFIATTTLLPQSTNADNYGLRGLAMQMGVDVGPNAVGESPEFYVYLLRSTVVLHRVLLSDYEVDGDTLNLLEEFEMETLPEREALLDGVDRLRDHIAVRADVETGLVIVKTSFDEEALARQVAARLVSVLNEFNLETRQSRARVQRVFVERQLQEAEDALDQAEDDLKLFLSQNRGFTDSPELSFRMTELERQVRLRQDLYTSLAQALQQARIDEVRDAPVFTVVESAERTVAPEKRSPLVAAVLGGFLGFFFSCLAIGIVEGYRHQRARYPVTFAEFETLRRSLTLRRGNRSARSRE